MVSMIPFTIDKIVKRPSLFEALLHQVKTLGACPGINLVVDGNEFLLISQNLHAFSIFMPVILSNDSRQRETSCNLLFTLCFVDTS